mgnify:CR=1 FL=1
MKKKKTIYLQHHLKTNTLVLVGGVIPGVIIRRISKFMYEVLSQGKIHCVHRDIIIEHDEEDDE